MHRDLTGLSPLDHVLGNGLVRGAVVLCAAPPNVGSTTLALQLLDGLRHRCLYSTGEETLEKVTSTAQHLRVATDRVSLVSARDLSKILKSAHETQAQALAIDSIQTLHCSDSGGRPGSPPQLTKCVNWLVTYAKEHAVAIWLVGRVNRNGDLAGPRTIEHTVDVSLKLEQGPAFAGNERILRCSGKNRFAASNLSGRFELTNNGLRAA